MRSNIRSIRTFEKIFDVPIYRMTDGKKITRVGKPVKVTVRMLCNSYGDCELETLGYEIMELDSGCQVVEGERLAKVEKVALDMAGEASSDLTAWSFVGAELVNSTF